MSHDCFSYLISCKFVTCISIVGYLKQEAVILNSVVWCYSLINFGKFLWNCYKGQGNSVHIINSMESIQAKYLRFPNYYIRRSLCLFFIEGELDSFTDLTVSRDTSNGNFSFKSVFKWEVKEWDKHYKQHFHFEKKLVLTRKMYTAWNKTSLFSVWD